MVKHVTIVNVALECDCPFTGEVYVLIRNAIHAPSMDHNLIPPLMLRAGSIVINYSPKIHCADTIVDDHSIPFGQSDLWVPFQLNGVFSFFLTRVSAETELQKYEKLS